MPDGSKNYAGNSNKSKEEGAKKEVAKPEIKQIATGGAAKRKKPLGRRVADTFAGDDAKTVGRYVLDDVIVPAVKGLFVDAANQFLQRMLFPGINGRGAGASRGTSYSSYSRGYSAKEEPRSMTPRGRATHDFDEIILNNRGEAEQVIDEMIELTQKYGRASVADLYTMAGITGSYTDAKWGWTDLRLASASAINGGYLLNLPKPEPLD